MYQIPIIYNVIVFVIALMSSTTYIHGNVGQNHTRQSHPNEHTRNIAFTSKLTDKKREYKFGIMHKPSKFKLTINGSKIKDGQVIHIPIENNKFLIRYDYEFKAFGITFAGYREAEFEIDPIRDHYFIDFSWKNENRFIVNHAHFIRITQIYEPGSEYAR